MLRDVARKYYLENNLNCAEAALLAANEAYQLGLTKEDIYLTAGFGGGIGCGRTCGAVCGCVSALGKMRLNGPAHDQPAFSKECGAFVNACVEAFGSCDCKDLKPKFFTPEERCCATVEKIVDVFEAHLEKSKVVG